MHDVAITGQSRKVIFKRGVAVFVETKAIQPVTKRQKRRGMTKGTPMMTRLQQRAARIAKRMFPALTKDQATLLASIKFPCC